VNGARSGHQLETSGMFRSTLTSIWTEWHHLLNQCRK